MKLQMLNGVVGAFAIAISLATPMAAAALEKENLVCEMVRTCLPIDIGGVHVEICVDLKQCRVETKDG